MISDCFSQSKKRFLSSSRADSSISCAPSHCISKRYSSLLKKLASLRSVSNRPVGVLYQPRSKKRGFRRYFIQDPFSHCDFSGNCESLGNEGQSCYFRNASAFFFLSAASLFMRSSSSVYRIYSSAFGLTK